MLFKISPQHVKGHSYWFWYVEVFLGYKKFAKLSIGKKIFFIVIAPPLFPILGGFIAEKLTYADQEEGRLVAVNVHGKRAITYFTLVGEYMSDDELSTYILNGKRV